MCALSVNGPRPSTGTGPLSGTGPLNADVANASGGQVSFDPPPSDAYGGGGTGTLQSASGAAMPALQAPAPTGHPTGCNCALCQSLGLADPISVSAATSMAAPDATSAAAGGNATTLPAGTTITQVGTGNHAFPSGTTAADEYHITEAGHTLDVYLPQNDPKAQQLLTDIAADYAQVPEANKGVVSSIEVDPNANPSDAYWQQVYNMPGFVSAATGSKGNITFYDGGQYLSSGVFLHETGHDVANAAFGTTTPPASWTAAAQADGNFVSSYAQQSSSASGSFDEDFAETYRAYEQAKQDGTLATFTAQYPNRSALIAQYEAKTLSLPPAGTGVTPIPKTQAAPATTTASATTVQTVDVPSGGGTGVQNVSFGSADSGTGLTNVSFGSADSGAGPANVTFGGADSGAGPGNVTLGGAVSGAGPANVTFDAPASGGGRTPTDTSANAGLSTYAQGPLTVTFDAPPGGGTTASTGTAANAGLNTYAQGVLEVTFDAPPGGGTTATNTTANAGLNTYAQGVLNVDVANAAATDSGQTVTIPQGSVAGAATTGVANATTGTASPWDNLITDPTRGSTNAFDATTTSLLFNV